MTHHQKYELVVGLEVHAQLLTHTKLFCGDPTRFGSAPNTQVSPISLGHPGTLPKLNKKAIELAIKLGLVLGCEIEEVNYFARKNYFYPDLPKGYQISQHTAPICRNGFLTIHSKNTPKNIQLNRIHIEEDAGKSIHDADSQYTCIDLNRAGVALLEIVTEPVIHDSEDAAAFLIELRKKLRWLDVCDGNMEEGSMRCDANISIRLQGEPKLGKRVEIKNLNSIKNVKKAIDIEFDRLVSVYENNGEVVQETRSYDADNNITFSLRNKEDAEDYRYFPEPDLPPFLITQDDINTIASSLPQLPDQLKETFIIKYGISIQDAELICNDREDVSFFEKTIAYTHHYKAVINWMIGPLRHYCNEHQIAIGDFPLSAVVIADLINLTESGKINFNNASGKILQYLINNTSSSAENAALSLNLIQNSDLGQISIWIEETLSSMPEKVKEYRSGKKGVIGLFAGDVKKRSQGKADMQVVHRLITEKLSQ